MNAFMMTLLAMLLSSASARTLKEHGGGEEDIDCESLVICVPKNVVGDKTLTIETHVNDGDISQAFGLYDQEYCITVIQGSFKGPNIDIAFFLNGLFVRQNNYQQNYCFMQAGAVSTDDHNADTSEGSWSDYIAGHITIKSLN
jgi:hypothetical protein